MAKKIEEVTDAFWENEVNQTNKDLIEDFLSQENLSKQTIKQYESSLKIFAKWVHDYCKNVDIPELRPRDARKYQDWLIKQGLGSSAIRFKRSSVSSLCNFIEFYYDREYRDFRNIFTKAIPNVTKNVVKEKIPLTIEEIQTLRDELRKREEWQKLAYLEYTYDTGCRREESRQLLKEVATYEKVKNKDGTEKKFYKTHKIRAKGKGQTGVVRDFTFTQQTMDALKKWVEYRSELVENDDCLYMFVSKGKNGFKQLSPNTFNLWCSEFSEILGGRPVHPHLFRSSRATNAHIEEGKSIKAVQKLLGHKSAETTEIYIVRDDTEDLDELYED